jgi:hypothetical protein
MLPARGGCGAFHAEKVFAQPSCFHWAAPAQMEALRVAAFPAMSREIFHPRLLPTCLFECAIDSTALDGVRGLKCGGF